MESTKQTSKIFQGITFFRIFKSSSVIFFTYDDILLRQYLEVIKSGDFTKLIKEGNATEIECLEAWENIVKKQEKATGSNRFDTFLSLLKGYALLINDHTVIRACLIHLMNGPVDWEVLKTLNDKGYEVKINEYGYAIYESIQAGLHRCENLVTKATMKQKELQRMFPEKKDKAEAQSFETVMAHLIAALEFNVDENITLARYNEYQNILRERQKAIEKANSKGKPQR